eukprot:2073582-Prorocentrum_lima.AAC.1
MSGIDTINWWADVGTHFRSVRQLYYSGYVWPQKYRLSFSIHYGLEAHMKGALDTYFGRLSQRIQQAEKATMITSIAELIG